jgi:hypothetical protein
MDALLTVEKEVDKAKEAFESFYETIDRDIDKAIEHILNLIREFSKCKDK